MKRYFILPYVLIALFVSIMLVGACGTMKKVWSELEVTPWSERTPEEKALTALSLYNRQYEDTMAMALKGDTLSDEQKEVVRGKKKILKKIQPLLNLYIGYVDSGVVPVAETEAKMIEYLNQLGGKL